MKTSTRLLLPILLMTTFFIYRCTTEKVAGIEITNGDCTGKIYNKDNTPAAGAVVRLIPSGYDPASASAVQIDSTTTDAQGSYLFRITTTDFYNIIAEKGHVSCIQDSIVLLADGKNRINPDTLEESGWLAGRIEVKPESDPLQAILIVPGTNRYTSPVDTLGNFPALKLPAGTYTVNVFTTETGYETVDSSITVPSGDTVYLNTSLPTSYAPEIQGFGVAFDSATMFATLSWDTIDQSTLRSFALHRYVNGAEDTIIIIDKNQSEYIDDCIIFYQKTVRYELAAVGLTHKEGYKAVSSQIVVCEKSASFSKTVFGNFTLQDEFKFPFSNLCVNLNGDKYLYNGNTIAKIAEDGSTVKKVDKNDFDSLDSLFISSVLIDADGNLYMDVLTKGWLIDDPCIRSVYKLDENLNFITSLPISDSIIGISGMQAQLDSIYQDIISGDMSAIDGYFNLQIFFDTIYKNFKFTVANDGTLYLCPFAKDTLAPITTILVYDANFTFKNTYKINGTLSYIHASNDTIITGHQKFLSPNPQDNATQLQVITIYDRSFNVKASYESILVNDITGNLVRNVIPLSGNRCMTITGPGYTTIKDGIVSFINLIISDDNKNIISRYCVPGDLSFYIKSADLIYGIGFNPEAAFYMFSPESFVE